MSERTEDSSLHENDLAWVIEAKSFCRLRRQTASVFSADSKGKAEERLTASSAMDVAQ